MEAFGQIEVKAGASDRKPYEHQLEAMRALDLLDREPSFSTMVVLPTGGGKTFTAVNWLLRHAIDRGKKVLWIAHRTMLLDQAADSFAKFAYRAAMPNSDRFFNYRIISGHQSHTKAWTIQNSDQLIIASKDSLRSHLDRLALWLAGESEAYLVVDEAHHATAKTYRRLIEKLMQSVPRLKVIGLTATPFRTLEKEQGLLSQIFKDGVLNGRVVKGDVGIAYQIGLQDLINKLILARPKIEACQTDLTLGDSLGAKEIDQMRRLDRIPEKIASQMIESRSRNKLIVSTYLDNRERFGKTILFALNVAHAVTLQELFARAGVKSGYVVSQLKDEDTGKVRPSSSNDDVIEQYRDGDLEVIINVNILTEGVDLPKTKTVFLTRPTSSSIMMTQMVGRALRGTKAGGTAECYIVTFIDGWDERVAWVNPSSLYASDSVLPTQSDPEVIERLRREEEEDSVRTISLSMVREFAAILDNAVDTNYIEAIPFIERIPLGMYMFTYTEQGEGDIEGADVTCEVMVYSSTKESYERFLDGLEPLTAGRGLDDEDYAPEELIEELAKVAEQAYFHEGTVPPYRFSDIASIIRYYVQFGVAPQFYPFDKIDRSKLDIGAVAKFIIDNDMGPMRQRKYEDSLWDNEDENLMRLLFVNKQNFMHAIDMEKRKLTNPEEFVEYLPQGNYQSETDVADDGPIEVKPLSPQIVKTDLVSEHEDLTVSEIDAPASSQVVVSGKRVAERVPRVVYQLKPDKLVFEAMSEYQPAGKVRSERSGITITRFGGKARECVDQGRLCLYSLGYRVAELEPDKRIRLLSYDLDGKHQGWDAAKNTLHHVADFIAFHKEMDSGPSKARIEELAREEGSGIGIAHVDVKVDVDLGYPDGKISSSSAASDAGSGEAETKKADYRYSDVDKQKSGVIANWSLDPFISASAAQSDAPIKAKHVDDPPALVIDSDFESFQELVPSGKINRQANTPFRTFNGRARLHKQNGFTYLYAKGAKTRALRIARWSNEDGLTLYEYEGKRGWSESSFSAISRDFATQVFSLPKGLTVVQLRSEANKEPSAVRIIDGGTPSLNGNLVRSASEKLQAGSLNSPSSPVRYSSVSSSEKATNNAREETIGLYKNGKLHQKRISDISCIKSATVRSCNVFLTNGEKYTLRQSFNFALLKLAPKGLFKSNAACLVRPSAILTITGDVTKEAAVKGVPMKIFVSDSAYEELVKKFWNQGRNS